MTRRSSRRDVPSGLRSTLLGLAQQMRSSDAQEAASAVLVAHDAFEELGVDPFFPRTVSEARHVVKTRYEVETPSRYRTEDELRRARYDHYLSTFRIAANNVESMLKALRWADRVRRGRFIGGRGGYQRQPPSHHIRIMKKGRVIARGKNLAAIDRYNRSKGHGATLILLQKVPAPGRPFTEFPEGIVHIYFRDATVSTSFGSYRSMSNWVRGKQWFKGTPIQEIG